jgi:DNA repair exonuclease SbcCD nuclease subunit
MLIKEDKRLSSSEILVMISDIHFGVRNNSLEWIENIKNYFYNFFIPYLKKLSNKKVSLIINGDVFDNRQSLDINVLTTVLEIFNSILEINKEMVIYIVAGNHDSYRKKENDITSLAIFEQFDRIEVIQKPTYITMFNGTKLLFVPWSGDMEQQNEAVNNNDADFIFMHNDIKTGYYDNNRPILNGVSVTTINNKKIYSGHIHKRYDSDKFTYIGSPYHLKRSDIGNTKGIYSLIYNKDNNKWEEVFTYNDYSPIFIRVKIEDILEKNIEELKNIFYNNYVDIVIKKNVCKYLNKQKLLEALSCLKYKKISIIVENDEVVMIDNIITDNNLSIEDIIVKKIEQDEGVSVKRKKEILKLNKEYLTTAFNIVDKDID